MKECRKDIVLENDFINKRNKDKNIPLIKKYTEKIKDNKMRFAYMFGFAAFFSMGYIYDRTNCFYF